MLNLLKKIVGKFVWAHTQISNYFSSLKKGDWQKEAKALYKILMFVCPKRINKLFDLSNIKKIKTKDTLFILGSGYSINDISQDEWQNIKSTADLMSFNFFFRGELIDIDYHVIREMVELNHGVGNTINSYKFRKGVRYYVKKITSNPKYKKTHFFVLCDELSLATNFALLNSLLPLNRVTAYTNLYDRSLVEPISETNRLVPHASGTLFDVLNLGYILGYKTIVLAGVDLYDRRYYWLRENETRELDIVRGSTFNDTHRTATRTLKNIVIWSEYFANKGVSLYTYNPKSLLTQVIPIYPKLS